MENRTGVLAATMAVGMVKLVATVGAALVLDDVGRRPLLIVSAVGVTAATVFTMCGIATATPVVTMMGQCLFVALFAVGYGPVCWLIISEIFPLRIRGTAMSIATAVNRVTSFLVAVTFLTFSKLLTTTGCYALYAGINVVGVFFCIYYVPETSGLSLEEIGKAMMRSHTPITTVQPDLDAAKVSDTGLEFSLATSSTFKRDASSVLSPILNVIAPSDIDGTGSSAQGSCGATSAALKYSCSCSGQSLSFRASRIRGPVSRRKYS